MPKTTIVGTVVVDPKQKTIVKKTGENVDLTRLVVVTSEIDDKNAQNFPIEVWGKVANHIFSSAKKGSLIKAECSIINNNYEKDGNKRYEFRFVADSMPVILRSSKKKSEDIEAEENKETTPVVNTNSDPDFDFDFGNIDNSLPF